HQGAERENRRTNAGERFFRKCARQGGIAERKAMIDRDHNLPLTRQAAVLNISRGSLYYKPRPVSAADLALMRRMDELHLEFPFAAARMLQGLLAAEGSKVGRRHVRTLMRRMGMETGYRRPNTSKPAPGHRIYPYLLRGLAIDRPNQVWAMDITYVAMARGFIYLAAVMDWFSRRVLPWRVSITMEAAFCVEALEEALARHGNLQHGPRAVSSRVTQRVECLDPTSFRRNPECFRRHLKKPRLVDGDAVMGAERGDTLARPAIAIAGHQPIPVQDAGDEIVVGDQHQLAYGGNHIGRGVGALPAPPPGQAYLGVDPANPMDEQTI